MTMFFFQICFFCCFSFRLSCCHLLLLISIITLSNVSFVFHVSIVIWFSNYIWFRHVVIFQNSFLSKQKSLVFTTKSVSGSFFLLRGLYEGCFEKVTWLIVSVRELSRYERASNRTPNTRLFGVRHLSKSVG